MGKISFSKNKCLTFQRLVRRKKQSSYDVMNQKVNKQLSNGLQLFTTPEYLRGRKYNVLIYLLILGFCVVEQDEVGN